MREKSLLKWPIKKRNILLEHEFIAIDEMFHAIDFMIALGKRVIDHFQKVLKLRSMA